jgi:DNA-binding GntR family transcriptional regulator
VAHAPEHVPAGGAHGIANGLTIGVYERLRSEIVHGRIRPNERLVEADLADRLNVSRTPVRESLQRLAADGLVVSRRRGWVVYEHSPAEVREIYEARSALESYAARLAAERASHEQLAHIGAILRDRDGILRSPRENLVDINEQFHDAIVEAADNQRIKTLILRNRLYYFNYRLAALYTDAEALASREQHEQLVAALVRRDGPAAEELTREHIGLALRVILSKIR